MAVDFSRAIRIRRSGTTYTYFGLTTAPSHYIAFRSQNAVRYLPLVNLNNSSIPAQSYLRCRTGGVGYCAYGSFTTTVKLQLRVEGSGMFGGIVYYRLVSVSNSAGGTSVATTVKVELIRSDGSTVWNTTTVTLPANTSSKTFNTDVKGYASFFFATYNKYRITVTCNGRAVKSSVGTFDNDQVGVQTRLSMRFAPW